ncbi:MAG: hypothetical protein AAF732_02620 [Pseudomonadota bacterium]
MLGRLVLIAFQVVIAWRLMSEIPRLLDALPFAIPSNFTIFAYALVFAVVVWLVGMLGALVLKDVPRPSIATLVFAIAGAAAFAALAVVPDIRIAIERVITIQTLLYPLIGAVIGYAIKR